MRALIVTLVTAVALMVATGTASARPAGPEAAASSKTASYTIVFDASKAEGAVPAADTSQSAQAAATQTAASSKPASYTIVFDASKAEGGVPAADTSQSVLGGIDTSSDAGIATLAAIAIGLGALAAGLGAGLMTSRHPVHWNRMHLH